MAEALYRKYRPQVFEDVVGQEPIERTLKNAIAKDKVSHAYLFCGPRGTGKTTTARLLAKALLCQQGPTPDPDGTCEDCRLVADGVHPDVYELDAASRTGVDNVREEIISRVQFAPTRGRSKVYIIDEVHMLSVAAFNALLKTLEEPPAHVVFVLCTTDPQKVPETIHSRCQRFDFRRIAPESMVSRLGAICIAEGVEFEGEALDLIAHRAEGGLRNALTSLEQIIAFDNGKVTLAGAERLLGSIDSNDMAEIVSYVGKRDIANCFRWTASYVETGADLAQFVRDMAEHVRNLYILTLVGDDVGLDVSEMTRHELLQELQWFGPDRLARLMGVLGDLSSELKTSSNPRLAFEIALTRMVRPDSDLTLEALAERIEALESGYSSVAHVMPGPVVRSVGALTFADDAPSWLVDDQPQENTRGWEAAQERRAAEAGDMRSAGFEGATGGVAAHLSNVHQAPAFGAAADGGIEGSAPGRVLEHAGAQGAQSAMGAAYQRESQHTEYVADWETAQREPTQQARAAQATARKQAVGTDAATAQGVSTQGSVSHPAEDASVPATQMQPVQAAQGGESDKLAMLSNPATVQRIWQAAISAVKKQKQAYGVLFMNVKVSFDQSVNALKIAFPAEASFAFNAVQKPEVQDAVGAALAHAVGTSVPFRYEQAGKQGSASTWTHPQAQAQQQVRAQQQAQPQHRDQGQAQSQVKVQPQAQPQAEVQPQGQPQAGQLQRSQPESAQQQPHSEHQAQNAEEASNQENPAQRQEQPQVRPMQQQRAATSADSQAAAQQSVSHDAPLYDDVPPYDDMPPYDDAYYEQVPYEELYDAPVRSSDQQSSSSSPSGQQPSGQQFASEQPGFSQHDAMTNASPVVANVTPEGALAEDPSNVEALLQAGFGGGVVFSEVDD